MLTSTMICYENWGKQKCSWEVKISADVVNFFNTLRRENKLHREVTLKEEKCYNCNRHNRDQLSNRDKYLEQCNFPNYQW